MAKNYCIFKYYIHVVRATWHPGVEICRWQHFRRVIKDGIKFNMIGQCTSQGHADQILVVQ